MAGKLECTERQRFTAPGRGSQNVHIGYNPIYEYATLPIVDRLLAAIRVVME